MPPKRSVTITAAWIALLGGLILAFATLAVPFIQNWLSGQTSSSETEYVGHVIDANTLQPIAGAKITLNLEGVPPIVYTDSEGIYRFKVEINSNISGQVRVDAKDYETYIRNITLSPSVKNIEDIRLSPQNSTPTLQTPSSLQLEVWSIDYFSNTQLNSPVVYHVDQPAEPNSEGGYTIQFNSVDLRSNPQIPQSNFSVRFSGLFHFEDGYYEFHCEHHDGCRIFVDGQIWVDAWWDGGGAHDLARDISAGDHIVSIEFYDKSGLGLLHVIWKLKVTNTPVVSSTPDPTDYIDAAGVPMRLVPAGSFMMGSNADKALAECQKIRNDCKPEWFIEEEPAHEVHLDAYYIDKYEVTNKLYRACVEADICEPPTLSSSNTRPRYYENSEFDNYPVIYVDWTRAKTYCEWRGGDLPTEAQWEKAARGADGRTYPWGEDLDPAYANYTYDITQQGIGDTTAVGKYIKGKSPYGVYDMAGNILEWVADWYSDDYYLNSPASNPRGPDTGQFRVLRGGSWFDDNKVSSFNRDFDVPSTNLSGLGFRCVMNVNP